VKYRSRPSPCVKPSSPWTHLPGIAFRVLDEPWALRRFVNVFVRRDVRFLDGLDTVLEAGQTVSLVPAVAAAECRLALATLDCNIALHQKGSRFRRITVAN